MKKSANEIDIHVGSMVRQLRTSRGIARTTLGEKLGITFQQIQKYEKGINRIGAGRLQDIATFFGVSVQDFYPATTPGEAPKLQAFSKDAGIVATAFDKIKDRTVQLRLKALIAGIAEVPDVKGDEAETPPKSASFIVFFPNTVTKDQANHFFYRQIARETARQGRPFLTADVTGMLAGAPDGYYSMAATYSSEPADSSEPAAA